MCDESIRCALAPVSHCTGLAKRMYTAYEQLVIALCLDLGDLPVPM